VKDMNSRINNTPRRTTWYCLVFLSFILLATTPSLFAQEGTPTPSSTPASQVSPMPQASPTPSLERRFFKNLLRDQRVIWTSPLRVRQEDAKWVAPLGATTLALIATDRRTAGKLDDDDDFRLDVSRGASSMGSIYTTGGIAATFYLVGRAKGNARARETSLLSMETLINGVAVYGVLKRVTQRPRPRQENGHARFFDEGNAFPSGHAVNAVGRDGRCLRIQRPPTRALRRIQLGHGGKPLALWRTEAFPLGRTRWERHRLRHRPVHLQDAPQSEPR
jgi:hypothetical protein